MILANREYVEIMVSALSGQTGVKVESSDTWAFDLEHKKLYYNPIDLIERPFHTVKGLVLHEMGHVMFTEENPGSPLFQKYKRMQEVYNMAEDKRIERKLKERFGRFAQGNLDEMNLDLIASRFEPLAIPDDDPLTQALLGISYKMEMLVNGFLNHRMYSDAKAAMHEDAKEALDKIEADQKFSSWYSNMTAYDSFKGLQGFIDQEVYPYIKKLLEKYPKKKNGKGKGQAQGQGQQTVKISGALANGLKAGHSKEQFDAPQPVPSYVEASALMRPYSNTLANRLLDVLKEKKAVHHSGQYKKGKLLSRNVAKIMTGEERVFSKRNNPDSPDYKVYLALDRSGSMGDDNKMTHAYMSAVLVYDTIKRMKMPVEIYYFGDETVKVASVDQKSDEFLNLEKLDGGTNDARMISTLAGRVKKDQEQPIIFIIGDGEGGSLPHGDLEYLKKRGFVMGIGIGEGTSYVTSAYPNGVSVPYPKDVPAVIIKTLRELIKR